jgi:hypothetical protein
MTKYLWECNTCHAKAEAYDPDMIISISQTHEKNTEHFNFRHWMEKQ